MSLKVGSNGSVRVEVAATQGGRRVAIYRGPGNRAVATCCTRSLRLAHAGVSGWAGHSGWCWPDTPVPGGGKSIRRVSGEYPILILRVVTLGTISPKVSGRILRPAHAGHSGLHHKSQQKTWQIFPGDSTQMLQDGKAGVWVCVRFDFPLPSKEIPILIVRLSYTQRKAKKSLGQPSRSINLFIYLRRPQPSRAIYDIPVYYFSTRLNH